MTATHMVFGTLCALGCAVGAADGRTWFGAGHYNTNNASYVWSNALLWERSAVAGEGGVATFGGECFKGFPFARTWKGSSSGGSTSRAAGPPTSKAGATTSSGTTSR